MCKKYNVTMIGLKFNTLPDLDKFIMSKIPKVYKDFKEFKGTDEYNYLNDFEHYLQVAELESKLQNYKLPFLFDNNIDFHERNMVNEFVMNNSLTILFDAFLKSYSVFGYVMSINDTNNENTNIDYLKEKFLKKYKKEPEFIDIMYKK